MHSIVYFLFESISVLIQTQGRMSIFNLITKDVDIYTETTHKNINIKHKQLKFPWYKTLLRVYFFLICEWTNFLWMITLSNRHNDINFGHYLISSWLFIILTYISPDRCDSLACFNRNKYLIPTFNPLILHTWTRHGKIRKIYHFSFSIYAEP